MSACELSIQEAYRRLGLEPDAGLAAAKSAFRTQVKALHPDTARATPETLARLANVVAAIRRIEAAPQSALTLDIRAADAERGVTRALRADGRPAIIRIPPGAQDGDTLAAVGDPEFRVTLRIQRENAAPEALRPVEFDMLDEFISEFSRPSAAARFARWIREADDGAPDGRSAA